MNYEQARYDMSAAGHFQNGKEDIWNIRCRSKKKYGPLAFSVWYWYNILEVNNTDIDVTI